MGRQKNMIINAIFSQLKFKGKRMHRGQHEEKADSQTHVVQQDVVGRLVQDYLDLFTPG